MKYGQLSDRDIRIELDDEEIVIKPYDINSLKNASYDISPTIIAMSTKLGMLETVYRDKKYPHQFYIYVKPNDSILMVSKEFIKLPQYISGYVVSRVSKIMYGFGHISTSIDPSWEGALLIGLNNPTKKPIKVYVSKGLNTKAKDISLATITFHYLNTPSNNSTKIQKGMRLDLLNKESYSNRKTIKSLYYQVIHPKRKSFTDFYFSYCNSNNINYTSWENICEEFQGQSVRLTANCSTEHSDNLEVTHGRNYKKEKNSFADYIITESIVSRAYHYLQIHFQIVIVLLKIICVVLVVLGILPNNVKETILELLKY